MLSPKAPLPQLVWHKVEPELARQNAEWSDGVKHVGTVDFMTSGMAIMNLGVAFIF